MDRLWTPWRMKYIEDEGRLEGCAFCRALEEKDDLKSLVLLRGKKAFIVLNKFPYSNGHLMAIPSRHVADLADLSRDEVLELFLTVQTAEAILNKALSPHGFNIGINLGAVGGAGMPGHLHVHLVPRWQGDSNFMPIIGKTKVIPEDLAASYRRLKKSVNTKN